MLEASNCKDEGVGCLSFSEGAPIVKPLGSTLNRCLPGEVCYWPSTAWMMTRAPMNRTLVKRDVKRK